MYLPVVRKWTFIWKKKSLVKTKQAQCASKYVRIKPRRLLLGEIFRYAKDKKMFEYSWNEPVEPKEDE